LAAFGSVPVVEDSPEQAFLHDERRQCLERAIASLSQEHRGTLLLFYTQGLPTPEIARILGRSDQQVRSQLSYARRRLRELLGPDEEPP
jgi:RNA polymerase sigma-70 factor (ECF subfamily)